MGKGSGKESSGTGVSEKNRTSQRYKCQAFCVWNIELASFLSFRGVCMECVRKRN